MVCLGVTGANALAGNADPLLMRAQSVIFPKIILLDKDLSEKTAANVVVIKIVHAAAEKQDALEMQKLIEAEYKNNLGVNPLRVETLQLDEFGGQDPATAYILMSGPAALHQKITQFASGHRRVVFSYDYKDMKNNALVSMLMKEKTYIYLNKSAMQQYDVRFLPLFYKIVKVLE
jgi:hypothetical protein